jgi:anti-sigma B factor antagonist
MARDAFDLQVDITGSRAVLRLSGDLDYSSCEQLLGRLTALSECTDIELDLGGVRFLDSSGVRALVRGQHAVDAHGAHLRIVRMSPAVREKLDRFAVLDLLSGDPGSDN